jgi:hypothetical protein
MLKIGIIYGTIDVNVKSTYGDHLQKHTESTQNGLCTNVMYCCEK